jgi:thiol-disulfide isomerase/thioredoxin
MAVKSFEKMLSKGPLTLVYINAKWCGACHQFSDKVWDPLTKLKNKNINLASVDSEMIGKTSLASVPRKFFPTLLLVGKDKKPATFKDESGVPTNAMPRNNTLSEDKEALTNLVQTPLPKLNGTMKNNSRRRMNARLSDETMPRASPVLPSLSVPSAVVSPVEQMIKESVGKSPFGPNTNVPSDEAIQNMEEKDVEEMEDVKALSANELATKPNSRIIVSALPPDVGADLVTSQSMPALRPESQLKGGSLLRAIRNKTASLKAMLPLHKAKTRRHK